eukprot:TRINITY_DN40058_c0_g1_i1.p1 TRINITY_DN40058_c0_g1~~TRINITY_DN40058_c0_g1_i1.p1  ORF type:complete len:465 (+),score=205.63 TRINITY_DN40058_c0_g1_i1:44-1396(+)
MAAPTDIPPLGSELRVDPRTGLDIVDVPLEHRSDFADLEGSLLHWFSKVRKMSARDRAQERIFLVTDSCMYLCTTSGGTTRCAQVKDIEECLTTKENDLSFRLPPPDQYDIWLLTSGGQKERDALLDVLRRVYQFHTGGQLRVRALDTASLKSQLQLKKPPGWELKIEPIKTKKLLAQQLQDQHQDYQAENAIINQEFERIRGKLEQELERQVQQRNDEFSQFKSEYKTLSDAHNGLVMQYDAMAADVETYVRLLNEKDAELERFREGQHPRIKELEHELERARMQQGLSDQQERADFRSALEQRDLEVQHHADVRVMLERRVDEAEAKMRSAERDSAARAEDVALLQQALRERDALLQAKDRELEAKEQRAAEKDREVRYTKALMRDAFRRQVEELEQIRLQFAQYDEQIVAYLERVFGDDAPVPPLPVRPNFSIPAPSIPAPSDPRLL